MTFLTILRYAGGLLVLPFWWTFIDQSFLLSDGLIIKCWLGFFFFYQSLLRCWFDKGLCFFNRAVLGAFGNRLI